MLGMASITSDWACDTTRSSVKINSLSASASRYLLNVLRAVSESSVGAPNVIKWADLMVGNWAAWHSATMNANREAYAPPNECPVINNLFGFFDAISLFNIGQTSINGFTNAPVTLPTVLSVNVKPGGINSVNSVALNCEYKSCLKFSIVLEPLKQMTKSVSWKKARPDFSCRCFPPIMRNVTSLGDDTYVKISEPTGWTWSRGHSGSAYDFIGRPSVLLLIGFSTEVLRIEEYSLSSCVISWFTAGLKSFPNASPVTTLRITLKSQYTMRASCAIIFNTWVYLLNLAGSTWVDMTFPFPVGFGFGFIVRSLFMPNTTGRSVTSLIVGPVVEGAATGAAVTGAVVAVEVSRGLVSSGFGLGLRNENIV